MRLETRTWRISCYLFDCWCPQSGMVHRPVTLPAQSERRKRWSPSADCCLDCGTAAVVVTRPVNGYSLSWFALNADNGRIC